MMSVWMRECRARRAFSQISFRASLSGPSAVISVGGGGGTGGANGGRGGWGGSGRVAARSHVHGHGFGTLLVPAIGDIDLPRSGPLRQHAGGAGLRVHFPRADGRFGTFVRIRRLPAPDSDR